MRNLFLITALFLGINNMNSQLWWIGKDTTIYKEEMEDKVFYDSLEDKLVVHKIKRARTIIETIDTLETNELSIIFLGNSKQFLRKYPNCLCELGEYKEGEKTKVKVILKKFYLNLNKNEKRETLFATKKKDSVFLETDISFLKEINKNAFKGVLIIIFILFFQIFYFVPRYKDYIKKRIRTNLDVGDGLAFALHVIFCLFFLNSKDAILRISPIVLFLLGVILRTILFFKPSEKAEKIIK